MGTGDKWGPLFTFMLLILKAVTCALKSISFAGMIWSCAECALPFEKRTPNQLAAFDADS